ncbi:hypothetical protein AXF42_Ash018976 [Apostasia shenzhenica]|uniref:DUF7725 domain-containing protein n=1 Tax=Apostasia shenzhenica TaxID=1088818 RepID=A0A2I0ABZ7_9ASPA|nr:hypothetical protein AXF42_Ash018976 [Apostasia shenzhenica]
MEAAAGCGGSLPIASTQPSPRKGWREYSSSNGGEESERVKYGASDERTIYEEGTGPLNVGFCSITIDSGVLNEESLKQRLQEISKKREELQHLEVELRVQAIARSEIMEIQNSYRSQIREHVDTATRLKDQIQQRDEEIHELEKKLEEKDRELHAVKIDTEAAWAKEDLLREQNIKLATFRRERDNSDAERAELLKQIHDLQELIRDKESQFLVLEEQHRVAQETMLYKDEQLREAQAWITRVQEVDALQSTTNQSLQAELRERTEQFNQYWIALQRQFMDMERNHLQIIHHLQLELAEARGRSGVFKDGSQITHENSADLALSVETKGHLISVNGDSISSNEVNLGSTEKVSNSNSTQDENAAVAPVIPSVLGMNAFYPAVQMAGLHPVVIHPQGIPQSIASIGSITPEKSSQPFSDSNVVANTASNCSVGSNIGSESNNSVLIYPGDFVPAIQEYSSLATTKTVEPAIFDERALLACIVRAIPAGSDGRIKISTTLPNRLAKMLAPLHWHDYEKHHGKLDDFVAGHPELFVIEGDFIHLREGAQEIISATAAVAKVAAASAASAPYSSLFPSVAVTPVSQSNRNKKASLDARTVNSIMLSDSTAVNNTGGSRMSDMNISNRTKLSHNMNGSASEMKPAQSNISSAVGNGLNRGFANGRPAYGGKQQGRYSSFLS